MLENRNTIIAIILSGLVLIAWQYFYNIPQMERQRAQQQAELTKPAQPAPAPARPPPAPPPHHPSHRRAMRRPRRPQLTPMHRSSSATRRLEPARASR